MRCGVEKATEDRLCPLGANMYMRKRGVAASLFVSLLLPTTTYHSAAAQTFDQFVALGDSSVDSG